MAKSNPNPFRTDQTPTRGKTGTSPGPGPDISKMGSANPATRQAQEKGVIVQTKEVNHAKPTN